MICVNAVNVCPSEKTIRIGEWYYGASVTVSPATATCKNVTWSSSNPDVASVNASSGAIYGLMPGTTKIYATAQDGSGRKDYCTITVSRIISVTSVSLNKSRITIENGSSHTLTATVYPENATNKTLSWTSENEDVATVNDGVVMAKGKGTTKIRAIATDGTGKSASCTVTVTEDILVSSVTVSPSSKTMIVGDTDYLYETVCPENATSKCVTWSSDDLSVATVNPESGLVYAQDVGTTAIRARAQDGSGKVGTCNLTVKPVVPVEEISICPNGKTMFIGETESLIATAWPGTATNKEFLWYSSDNSVASVDLYSGVVTAKGAGIATITVTTKDFTCSDTVTIKVLIDSVTIMNDYDFNEYDSYNKVVFNSSGKVWHCINRDMIYGEYDVNSSKDRELSDRMNSNYFEYYESIEHMDSFRIKTYTDEEIKLLYAIDPYGVAAYVQRYADEIMRGDPRYNDLFEDDKNDLRGTLGYKDHIYELLFHRKPQYFKRNVDGTWSITFDTSNVQGVLSGSETLFGVHNLSDINIILGFIGIGVGLIVDLIVPNLPIKGKVRDAVEFVAKVAIATLVVGEEDLSAGLKSFFIEQPTEEYLDEGLKKLELSWAYKMVSTAYDLNHLIQRMIVSLDQSNPFIWYCANHINYEISVELLDGEIYKMKDIHEALSNL